MSVRESMRIYCSLGHVCDSNGEYEYIRAIIERGFNSINENYDLVYGYIRNFMACVFSFSMLNLVYTQYFLLVNKT